VIIHTQVMYDQTGGAKKFRETCSVNLGWWHTYKHAAMKLWERFAPSVIAPMWHCLYPNSQFHIHPSSFPSVLYHLLALHLAYPLIKPKLDSVRDKDPEETHRRYINTAKDFTFLFEFAIPTVNTCLLCVFFQIVDVHHTTVAVVCCRSLTTESQ
jgi:hypothetical protein